MADFILRTKAFPGALQSQMAERIYLEQIGKGDIFSPYVLPETVRVAVNEKSGRPYYVVTWAVFDGSNTLPMVYVAGIEDSSENIQELLVGRDGKINPDLDIPLPVGGLLNPQLAAQFDDFASKNGAYSLTPATIATNMDKDFPTLHPAAEALRARAVLFGGHHREQCTDQRDPVAGEEARKRLAAHLDSAGSVSRPSVRRRRASSPRRRRCRNSTSTPTTSRPPAWAFRPMRNMRWCRTTPIRPSMPRARPMRSSAITRSM
jgi:hypothetical protein